MRITERLAARSRNAGANRPVLIVCLGDSVTHCGFELSVPENRLIQAAPDCRPWEGYPMKLQRKLTELYPYAAPTVLNAGVGGDAVAQMAERLDRDVLSFHPDLVILELGLNDCLGSPVDDPSDFARQVGALMDRILQSGAELMLLTPNAMCTRMHPAIPEGTEWHQLFIRAVQAMNSGKMTAFINAIRAEAAARNVPIADAYARWEQMLAAGVDVTSLLANHINHPIPSMHDLFVETIMQTVFAANCCRADCVSSQ